MNLSENEPVIERLNQINVLIVQIENIKNTDVLVFSKKHKFFKCLMPEEQKFIFENFENSSVARIVYIAHVFEKGNLTIAQKMAESFELKDFEKIRFLLNRYFIFLKTIYIECYQRYSYRVPIFHQVCSSHEGGYVTTIIKPSLEEVFEVFFKLITSEENINDNYAMLNVKIEEQFCKWIWDKKNYDRLVC